MQLGSVPACGAREIRLDRLEHFSTKDGLSQDWVRALYQDRQGFLWIGTDDGLNRYDGYTFKVYRHDPDDSETLTDNFVNRIAEDRQGNLWIATRRGLNLLHRSTDRFERFLHDPNRSDSLSHDDVFDVLEDRFGLIWVVTSAGVDQLDRSTGRFLHFPSRDALSLFESKAGDLWVGGSPLTLNKFDRDEGRFRRYAISAAASDVQGGESIWTFAEDDEGRLWLAPNSGGLVRFDPHTDERRWFLTDPSESALVLSILPKSDETLWVSVLNGGVRILNPRTGEIARYHHDPDEPDGLGSDWYPMLYEDRTGVTWIGTGAGLDKFVPARERFSVYRHKLKDPNSLSGNFIWPIHGDSEGRLWVGTLDAGLNRLDRSRGAVTRFTHDPEDPNSLSSDIVTSLLEDSEGVLWIGTGKGLDRFDPVRERFLPVRPELGDADGTDGEAPGLIYGLVEDRAGLLWIGDDSLWSVDKQKYRFRRYAPDPDDPDDPGSLRGGGIYSLLSDRRGDLWIGMISSGVSRFDPRTETFQHFYHDPTDPRSLSNDAVTVLFEDRSGTLWLGTLGGGLNRFDPETESFTHYREKDGLANDNILGILEDDQGYLWVSSNRGLSRFDPAAVSFKNYSSEDGLLSNAMALQAAWKSPDGEMFFGSPQGLHSFYPEDLVDDPHAPSVAITDFQILNESTPWGERLSKPSTLDDPAAVPHLVLTHHDKIFAFEFAALHFQSPGKNRYAYRLKGFQDEWIEEGAERRFAQYTNLDPGEYTFQVKAANPDGVWNEQGAAVRLTILPPPWWSWWAQALYVLAFIVLVAAFVGYQQKKLQREQEAAERERRINARLREVDRLKDQFLANTSHELRTPLFGIIGLAESMRDQGMTDAAAARRQLDMIIDSGHRLHRLVGDILDFSRIDQGDLAIQCRPLQLSAIVASVLDLLRPLAQDKGLVLENEIPDGLSLVEADEPRLEQILLNLVGNAIKFTDQGTVSVAAAQEGDRVRIRVRDTGIGISEEHRWRIFEPFEQVDGSMKRSYGGAGLGLAVSRRLVELHGGEIEVESTPGEGSVLSFTLPVAGAEDAGETVTPLVPEPASVSNPQPADVVPTTDAGQENAFRGGPRILLVDDEPINRMVIREMLQSKGCTVAEAAGGLQALDLLDDGFDMVLLDVMMPKMSGYEVCLRLRKRFPSSELPVLFISAKDRPEDLAEGFAVGGTDYLTKPVEKEELLRRVQAHLHPWQGGAPPGGVKG
jgi:signal transduction histidine kinase/ligand-binding sensor domain-containing protein/ActR/RegA family two-component response regulator